MITTFPTDQIIGVLNKVTGAMTCTGFTGIGGGFQDIFCSSIDADGTCYAILALTSVAAVNNHIYRINAGYSSFSWNVVSGYSSFTEQYVTERSTLT
jgi:hypothetical protein